MNTEKSENEEKIEKVLYIFSIILFAISFIPFIPIYIKIILYTSSILLAGYEIISEGIKNIFKLNFEEETLMTIAVIAAFILGEYNEACLVILLFKLGEIIEEKATEKSNKSIHKIVEIKATNANLVKNEDIEVVDVKTLKIGDIILIKPGEMIPVDCKVLSGTSSIDMSNITGESIPVEAKMEDLLLSGAINIDGSLKCTVTKTFENSTASQIVDLVKDAQNNKGKTEEFITKFSKIYTPIVLILAVFIAIIPAILGLEFKTWLMRALVFLVASCPCSIVISVPLALYTCIGAVSRKGILIKGTKHIETVAESKIIAFDKTGTLTTGKMKIEEIKALDNYTEKEILEYIYALERNSSHPISTAITQKIEESLKDKINIEEVENYKEIAGCGISGTIKGKNVLFGNEKLLKENNIKYEKDGQKTVNYLVLEEKIIGEVLFSEDVREEVGLLMSNLNKVGIEKTVMLTGDGKEKAEKVANKLGIQEVYSSLLPQEKLEKVKELKKQGKTIFVGDGINDSPVLASADFSISIGEGTEIANDTADSILISNQLKAIPDMIKICKKTMNILKTNIAFSLIVKAVVLVYGILGISPIWLAVFADVGVTLITVINSIRIK